MAPEVKEEVTATVEVRQVYHISKVGTVAGAYVVDGKVQRSNKARVIRDGIVVHTGQINALKRFKDDVKEVGTYLTGIFPLLFVPAAAGVMELWAEMGEMLLPILIAIIPVTVLVMVSAGKTTQALTGCKNKEADNDAAAE